MLADLKSGKMTPLTNTPDAEMLGYHHDDGLDWSPDSRRIAVSNSFFPLPPPGKSSKLVLHPCVLVVDLGSSKVALVRERDYNNNKQLPVWDLRWNKDGSVLQIQGDGLGQSYKKQGDDWLESGEPAKVAGEKIHDLEVFRYQSLNSPPVLIAHLTGETEDLDSLVKTQKAKIILNPNPQLADVEPGECSVYKWKDKGGRDCLGGLLKPPGYKPGLRYPLLVQTHLFNQYEFFNLGASSTGNPGRALAARGVMVLQAGEPRQNSKYRGTPLEAEKDGRDCYVSAIKQLAAEGLIDAQNTGIIGFSRTGWYVLDSLIHASEYFRAATVADANSSSYGEYLRNVDINSDGSNYLDGDYGCKPYGEGLKNWMESASGFNLDKVRAPVLVQYSDPYGLLDWSTYPVLRMQGKPVDLLYFRNGSHTESKPKLVFASVETNADWFDFWLNGKEDQDPAKAAQYARWRGLRKLQDSGSKK